MVSFKYSELSLTYKKAFHILPVKSRCCRPNKTAHLTLSNLGTQCPLRRRDVHCMFGRDEKPRVRAKAISVQKDEVPSPVHCLHAGPGISETDVAGSNHVMNRPQC